MPRSVYHILVLVSSAVELVYEILWMRRFTLLFGGTAPAGAITLSAMFLGMAVGSAVIGRLASRWTRTLQGFALLQLGMAVGAALLETILGLPHRYSTLRPPPAVPFTPQPHRPQRAPGRPPGSSSRSSPAPWSWASRSSGRGCSRWSTRTPSTRLRPCSRSFCSGLPSEPRLPDGSSCTASRRGERRPGPGRLPV